MDEITLMLACFLGKRRHETSFTIKTFNSHIKLAKVWIDEMCLSVLDRWSLRVSQGAVGMVGILTMMGMMRILMILRMEMLTIL